MALTQTKAAAAIPGTSPPPTCAADVMTAPAVSVPPQATVRDAAALLLRHRISAAPVVDAAGVPIGMVSEGDLLGRGAADRIAGADWWLTMLASGPDGPAAPTATALARPVGEVMHRPVLTVAADATLRTVADLLQQHGIKRLPVMRGGKLVGIVSRADLVRVVASLPGHAAPSHAPDWLANMLTDFFGAGRLSTAGDDLHAEKTGDHGTAMPEPAAQAAPPMTGQVFRDLVDAATQAKIDTKAAAAREDVLARGRQVKRILQEHLDAGMWRMLLTHARVAASQGAIEFELLRFPAELCTDRGRRIDVAEADWPETLRGEAAELYDRFARELKPAGFGLAARVLDYPNGRLGDVGLFLTWAPRPA